MTSSFNNGAYVAPPAGPSQQSSPLGDYATPSYGLPTQQLQQIRGICTLQAEFGTLQFRTNPNEITWDYNLITHTEETYGGRVIQVLGAKMDNLVVKVDCGQGGWPYAMYVVQFMRDLMVTQRDGKPATLTYTTRNWQLKVFAQNVPYHDAVQETIRELTLNFKIQEDISGIQTSASISRALSMLVDGIGFTINDFNTFIPGSPANSFVDPSTGGGPATLIQNSPTPNPATAATGPPATGIPATGNVTNFFSGLIPGL